MPRQRRPHHAPEDDARAAVEHGEGAGMAAPAGTQDLRHDGAVEEGDREGGRYYQTCRYEGHDAQDEQ